MKKYLFSLLAFVAIVGCSKDGADNGNNTDGGNTPEYYTAPLTIDLKTEEATRAFDADWNWEWSDADTIYVCQNAGNRIVTPMTYIGDGKFYAEVAYATQEPADFYFLYGGKFKHTFENGEYVTSHIVPKHGATWTPVMVGTALSTTVPEISEVMLYPASGAIEIRAWEADRITPAKIKRATLKVIGLKVYLKWDALGQIVMDIIDESTPEDEIISAYCEEGSSSLFIQMPTITEADNMSTEAVKIEITNSKDETISVGIPFSTINIGKRSVMNVVTNAPNYAEIYEPQAFHNQMIELASGIDPTVTNKMKFIANSDIDTESAIRINGISNTYATLSADNTTVEIHTPKPEFYVRRGVDIGNMFQLGEVLTSLDLGDNFNTETVTQMDTLFPMQNLQYLYLGKSFTTRNVTNMSMMFAGCLALTNWDFVADLETSNVTDMSMMFAFSSINNPDFSKWNTSKVTNMEAMFGFTIGLTEVDLSSFNTANVTKMESMFSQSAIQNLDLSGFNTSKVVGMNSMFSGSAKMQSLNLSSFDFSSEPNIKDMFCWILRYTDQNGNEHESNPQYIGQDYFQETGEKCKIYISQEGYDYLSSKTDLAESARFSDTYNEFIIVD